MKKRQGTSLFELILVLAIIVVASALAVPSLGSLYGSYKLNGAVDSVRSAWAEARARAIEEGRAYRFAVEPQGTAFRVAPDHPDYWNGSDPPSDDPLGVGYVLEKSLPGGVRFSVNGETDSDSPPNEPEGNLLAEKEVQAADWSSAVIFLADGTAREDVKIVFQIRGARTTSLQLRGLTGHVSAQSE
jgi:type II secretory pathway pseudopilin PulG